MSIQVICTGACLPFAFLSALPSFIWLFFFFLQDKHREKIRNIASVFFWGIAIALPIVLVEGIANSLFLRDPGPFMFILFSFVGVALVEEVGKYLVVRWKAAPYSFFNEPQDAIIYMVTAALGFAAIENILFTLTGASTVQSALHITAFRGVSAVFLHAVASGALGYFLALAKENPKERIKFLFTGIVVATLLHGIYNNFIMKINALGSQGLVPDAIMNVILTASTLVVSGVVLLVGMHKLLDIQFASKNTKRSKNKNNGEKRVNIRKNRPFSKIRR